MLYNGNTRPWMSFFLGLLGGGLGRLGAILLKRHVSFFDSPWYDIGISHHQALYSLPISARGFITIMHANQEYSRYDHLAPRSSKVKVGQTVSQVS